MLIEKPACTLIGKITGGKTGDRHGLLDYLLCRWSKAQFEPLRFVFPLGRCQFLTRGWHDHSLQTYVRQNAVLDKSDGRRPPILLLPFDLQLDDVEAERRLSANSHRI